MSHTPGQAPSVDNDLDELSEGLSHLWGHARDLGTKLLDGMNEHVLGGSLGVSFSAKHAMG